MAKNRRGNRGRKCRHRNGFADSDFEWLAEQFQEQAEVSPDLTLEEFAIRRGVQPEQIRRFIAPRHTISVWHGTTAESARAIREDGFRTTRKIWFTQNRSYARSIAEGRAAEHSKPVVLHCEIDLTEYPEFEKPRGDHYAFSHNHIGKDVIRNVAGRTVVAVNGESSEKEDESESIDVAVTKTAGKLGVLWWMNRYLELNGREAISEEHPAVEAVFEWVQAQYAASRDEPISEPEMVAQVERSEILQDTVRASLKREIPIGEKE